MSALPARQPLSGVRVLDLGQVWAGPQLGCYLADFGADVILVETGVRTAMQASTLRMSAVKPDGTYEQLTDPDDPRAYNGLGRNRRCITLNLEHPDGRELLLRLVGVSDIVFDNFAPRAVQKLGIGYEVLRRVNPGIIVASLSAAGQNSPWADVLTYGPSLTALFGWKSLLGYAGEPRVYEDVSDFDPTASTYAVVAVLAALRRRRRTGKGQFIDIAQGEAGISALAEAMLEYTLNRRVLGPGGNRHRMMAPHGIYPTVGEDRWIAISVDGDAGWRTLCAMLGRDEATADPRFCDAYRRLQNVEVLDELVAGWTRPFDADELAEQLQAAGVAAFPVLDSFGVLADEQLSERRRDRFVSQPEGISSDQILAGAPWLLSKSRPVLHAPAKPVGADNRAVLYDTLGLTDADLDDAIRRGAVA